MQHLIEQSAPGRRWAYQAARRLMVGAFWFMTCASGFADDEIQILFLGDNGPHRPRERFELLEPVLRARGIAVTYTDKVSDLNPSNLAEYDGLLLYANTVRIESAEEKALLEYVAQGGGFLPIHCASFCFQNSNSFVELVGAQFQRHGWERMRDTVIETEHPITKGYEGFESLDETYKHRRHNSRNRLVLAYRIDGDQREPWTWVRTHGKGRVFYTAWGHDHNTWNHSGFHNLLERGILWVAGRDPAEAGPYLAERPFIAPPFRVPAGPEPFDYVDVGPEIPNYVRPHRANEPLRKMQVPLAAEKSMRRIVVPEGFHLELVAAEPQLGGKPICMAWDERGRMWIAETLDYPNELQRHNRGRDRIRICEDTDSDGRADKFTVFAEDLSIPTSITFSRGGVIVHNGTETLYLKDTDGDDRADERRVLLETWAMGDTHGGPSNMQYGLDNWIWGMQGYNNSTIRINGKSTQFRQGFHRFRPDGSEIEFLRSTNNNTWGLGISEEGIVFGSTANGNPSNYMPIPNRYYERVRGWSPQLTLSSIADSPRFQPITDKVRQVDHHGNYTAGAGHALYTARAYPQQYWNRAAFVCGPTGHLVGMFVLSADGADFHSHSPGNLLASDDEWVAPIMAEVGPDGNVWVLDWYNFIVQHNPTPPGFPNGRGNAYETKLRDKRHGRIYRVVYDKAPPAPSLDLSNATPIELVAMLANDNLLWRRHAQRLLVERGQLDVVAELLKMTSEPSVDQLGLNVGAIHALWTLHGLGALDGKHPEVTVAVVAALRHRSAGVRRNAVQVLPYGIESIQAILDARLLEDPAAQVRLMTVLALADLPASRAAGQAIAQFLARPENANDRWLEEAATSAGATNAIEFLLSMTSRGTSTPQQRNVCTIVANHYARTIQGELTPGLLASLAKAEPCLAGAVIAGIEQGWQPDTRFPSDAVARQAVKTLRERLNLSEQVALARLAMRMKNTSEARLLLEQLTDDLFERVQNVALEASDRVAAAELIVAAQPDSAPVARRLLDLVTPQASPELSLGIYRALRESRTPTLGALVLEKLATLTPTTREAALELLLGRPELTRGLLDAMDEGSFQFSDLSLIHKQRLNSYADRRLRRRAKEILARGGQSINADRKQILADFADLVDAKGDMSRGKHLFTKHCGTCHKYQGEGSSIGPDLTGIGVTGKEQLLVHILDPSRDVEANFQSYMVLLQDGRTLTGVLAGEAATSVELIDAEAKRHTILREDIDELSRSATSFMPEGFERQLSRAELSDLLDFLTQPTAFVPLDVRRVANVSSAVGMFQSSDSEVERLVFDDWDVKTFNGVPFYPIDPQDGRAPNVIMLHGDRGTVAPRMPHSVELPCGRPAKAIHFLSGVSGWGFPATSAGSVSMIVRLHYADGSTEDHPLVNGVHFADYLGHTNVSGSQLAFTLGRQQLRYFKIEPQRSELIGNVELVKGPDSTAPVVMCMTVEQL